MRALGAWSKMQQLLRGTAVVALLFGVLLMHSLPLAHPGAGHTPAAAHASGLEHSHGAPGANDAPQTAQALAGTLCQGDCTSHTALHMCVAIVMVAAALVVATWLLTSYGDDRRVEERSAWLRSHASRAPPWTTPTLAQLSVLRV